MQHVLLTLRKIPVPVRLALLALFAAGMALAYRRCATLYPIITDYSNQMLEGEALLTNPLLRYWHLTSVSFYTTDIPFFALGILIRGFHPGLLRDVPTVVFCVTLGIGLFLASRRRGTPVRHWAGAAIAFALLGLPSKALAQWLLSGPFRVGTMMLTLFAYAALDSGRTTENAISPGQLMVFGLLLTLALIADTFLLYVVVLPILLVSALRYFRGAEDGRATEAWIAGITVLAVVLAKLTLRAIAAAGGFVVPDYYAASFTIIPLMDLGRNLVWTVEGIQTVYGNDFWGQPVNLGTILRVLNIAGMAALLFIFGRTMATLWREARGGGAAPVVAEPPADRISAFLAGGVTFNLLAHAFTTLPQGLATLRYFVPMAIFGAVLAGRSWGMNPLPDARARRLFALTIAFSALLSLAWFVRTARQPPSDLPAVRVADWLERRGLTDGYGGYWSSADITVLSRQRVRVRQINAVNGGIAPLLFGSDERWYDAPARFVVVDDSNVNGINVNSIKAAFGQPAQQARVENLNILIYDHNLAPLLKPAPESRWKSR